MGNSQNGRLVLSGGVLSEYVVVGRARSSPYGGHDMAMRVDRAGRGIYYQVEVDPADEDDQMRVPSICLATVQ